MAGVGMNRPSPRRPLDADPELFRPAAERVKRDVGRPRVLEGPERTFFYLESAVKEALALRAAAAKCSMSEMMRRIVLGKERSLKIEIESVKEKRRASTK